MSGDLYASTARANYPLNTMVTWYKHHLIHSSDDVLVMKYMVPWLWTPEFISTRRVTRKGPISAGQPGRWQ